MFWFCSDGSVGSKLPLRHTLFKPLFEMSTETISTISFPSRLRSFAHWTNQAVNPVALATAGLRYLGVKDAVECDYCDVQIQDWVKGDDPIYQHLKLSPSCKYAIGASKELRRPLSFKERKNRYVKSQVAEPPEAKVVSAESTQVFKLSEARGACADPVHPHMRWPKDRFATFCWWMGKEPYNPNELSRAGFFLNERNVWCFHCGANEVYSKVPEGSAYEFHYKLNRRCQWLLATKYWKDDGFFEVG